MATLATCVPKAGAAERSSASPRGIGCHVRVSCYSRVNAVMPGRRSVGWFHPLAVAVIFVFVALPARTGCATETIALLVQRVPGQPLK